MMTFAAHAALQRMSDLMKHRIPAGVIAMVMVLIRYLEGSGEILSGIGLERIHAARCAPVFA
jgi:hypothetical protein